MLRCVAIDDEPIALAILIRYCEKHGDIMLETYTSPVEGMARIKACKPDVVLLDIEMNGVSGLELAKRLPQECCLIFTTAYAGYALDGFNVNALDFLHKPYFYERFCKAMQKAEQQLQMNRLLKVASREQRQLMLKVDYRNVLVSVDTIVYIESIGNYVRLHLTDGSSVMSKRTLGSIRESLPEEDFLQIHRSFVVARRRIDKFTGTEVLVDGKRLPIGRKYASQVADTLLMKHSCT
ncbi:MAG: LytR/AlgR family response regulator transcription factor [Prevotella sp.]